MDRPVPIRSGLCSGEVIAYDPAVHTILVEWDHGELESHELRAFHKTFRERVLMQVAFARRVARMTDGPAHAAEIAQDGGSASS